MALGDRSALAGKHTPSMWRVAPMFDLKNPTKAIATLASAIPDSFPDALDFYTQYNYRMSPKMPAAIFKMDLRAADPQCALSAIIKMVQYKDKYGRCEEGLLWLNKTLPALAQSLRESQSLGIAAEELPDNAAYWIPVWLKDVHGCAPDSVTLPEEFDGDHLLNLVK